MAEWNDLAEAYRKQQKVIQLLSEVNEEMTQLLLQHISAEEMEMMPCADKKKAADEIRKTIRGEY